MAAKRIDAHRPLFDQQFARLVQHQRRLLLRALDRNEAHSGARHRFAAGIGVDRVVLAALDIGLGVSRRHQQHFVTHGLEFTRPIMRRAAGLHTDEARLDLRKEFVHLRAPQLPRYAGADIAHKRVDLKIILC